MKDEELSPQDIAETIRKKYRYRELILSGKLKLPFDRAAQLLGPDCLYQLYSLQKSSSRSLADSQKGRKTVRR